MAIGFASVRRRSGGSRKLVGGVSGQAGGPARHAFVDESFAGAYLVAAVIIPAAEVTSARQSIRCLLDKQQRRLHFKDESHPRKSKILDALDALDIRARIYITAKGRGAREECFTRLVPDLVESGVTRLVIERADHLVDLDRRLLFQLVKAGPGELEYDHLRAHEDLLLCAADAVAWCAAKGGPWRERISSFTTMISL